MLPSPRHERLGSPVVSLTRLQDSCLVALRPARLLPPKRLLTPRSARRLSATNRGLLPGAPAITRAGLAPAGLVQFSGRNTLRGYSEPLSRDPLGDLRRSCDAGGRSGVARARIGRPKLPHARVPQASTRGRVAEPDTTSRSPSPLRCRHPTPGRRCLGRLLGRLLVGANCWRSSRFTFVVCRSTAATSRDAIEVQGSDRRLRRL